MIPRNHLDYLDVGNVQSHPYFGVESFLLLSVQVLLKDLYQENKYSNLNCQKFKDPFCSEIDRIQSFRL